MIIYQQINSRPYLSFFQGSLGYACMLRRLNKARHLLLALRVGCCLLSAILLGACCPEGISSSDAGSSGQANGDGGTGTLTPRLSIIQNEVFDRHCVTDCHESVNSGAGLQLSIGKSHSNLVNQRSSRISTYIRVIPGNSNNSLLINIMTGDATKVGYPQMPRNAAPRPTSEIEGIRRWIFRGALDD